MVSRRKYNSTLGKGNVGDTVSRWSKYRPSGLRTSEKESTLAYAFHFKPREKVVYSIDEEDTFDDLSFNSLVSGFAAPENGGSYSVDSFVFFVTSDTSESQNEEVELNIEIIKSHIRDSAIMDLAERTLKYLEGRNITHVLTSYIEEEGLMLEFMSNETYHQIEFFDDGDIVFLKKKNKKVRVWDPNIDTLLPLIEKEIA